MTKTMRDETLQELLLKILKRKQSVADFLKLHKGKTPTELIEEAMSFAQTKAVVRHRQRSLDEAKNIRELKRKVEDHDWATILFTARALVLCGLPYRATKERQIVKTARLGNGQFVKVVFTALGEEPLPYGRDRALLSWLSSGMVYTKSPVVHFQSPADYHNAFGDDDGGASYQAFYRSLKRIEQFSILITLTDGEENEMHKEPVIVKSRTPRSPGQKSQKGYTVEFSAGFFKEMMEHGIPLPLELLRRYSNNPLGWDFVQFMAYRSKIAREPSRIPLEYLAQMLGTKETNLRKLKMKLSKILVEIKDIWPQHNFRFEGKGIDAKLYVAPPKGGHQLVAPRVQTLTSKRSPRLFDIDSETGTEPEEAEVG